MKIIDAHTHTDYISHKIQQDVVGSICNTTNEQEWQSLVNIMQNDKCVYGAFGVHPWFVNGVSDNFEIRFEELLKQNNGFMVGEIGLDKYKPYIEKQIDIFQKQFDIAMRLNRNTFLHCVGAWDKILNVLKQYKKQNLPIIVAHDFHGSISIIKTLLDNYNVMFSFNKTNNVEYLQYIPNNNILVETDGKRDILLKDVIDKIADIKQEKDIGDIIYNNTVKVIKNE